MLEMTTPLSDTPCKKCRQRRVKCDKRLPGCVRCETLQQSCSGYDQGRKFLDEGSKLRRKHRSHGLQTKASAPSPSHPQNSGMSESPSSHADKDAFHVSKDSSVCEPSLPLPQDGRSNSSRPSPSTSSTATTHRLMHRQEANFHDGWHKGQVTDSHTATADLDTTPDTESTDPDLEFFDLDPDTFYASHSNQCGFLPSVPLIGSDSDHHIPQEHGPLARQPVSGVASPSSFTDIEEPGPSDCESEIAYLTRHFVEVIGPWLDIYDGGKYFGSLVPIRALRNALLRYALAAAAAKQLGRIAADKKLALARNYQQLTHSGVDDYSTRRNWCYTAANYYDKAISRLRIYLHRLSEENLVPVPQTPSVSESSLSSTETDDLLAAVSIFSLYDFFDNFEADWLQHLNGLQSLLISERKAGSPVLPRRLISTGQEHEMTRGRRAVFWNFAREDCLASYMHRTRTRLDTEDMSMWRHFGLQITDSGSLYAAAPGRVVCDGKPEDLIPHTLLWIVLKIMNYVATAGTSSAPDRYDRWIALQDQLEIWHRGLPDHFQPYLRNKHRAGVVDTEKARQEPFSEQFFSLPMYAAAMQLYHFACILLLLEKPATAHDDRGSIGGILRSYRQVLDKVATHSREICGIALAHREQAVRVQMQQPLYVAGLCLDTPSDRRVILDLLQDIEAETGCSSKIWVRRLLNEGDTDMPDLGRAASTAS